MRIKHNQSDKDKQVKPFYRKWWFWVLIVIVIGVIASSNDTNDTNVSDTNSNTTNQVETDTINDKQENEVSTSSNEMIDEVKKLIQDSIDSESEVIKDVFLKDGVLNIIVDLTNADPAPFTIEDLAISKTSSITDAILELKDYDDLWNEIIIDFGNVGKISNSKKNIKENEYGMRYFASESFVLEK